MCGARSRGERIGRQGLRGELMLLIDPAEDLFEQSVDAGATMVTSDALVHSPPNTFDRVGLRSILGQVVQPDSVSPNSQVFCHLATVVERGIVADHVNDSVGP